MGRIFGTDGVRGIVNKDLTPELALRLGASICTVFGEKSEFLVGRDVRLGGDYILKAVLAGLEAAGCIAYNAGLVTTPALQYYIRNTSLFDGGVMVTASHNPPMYNGIKVIASDGIEIPRNMEREIEGIFFAEKYNRMSWRDSDVSTIDFQGVNEYYIKGVTSLVDDEVIRRRHLKVVFDGANSVGNLVIPQIIRRLGGKPISINGHLDSYFPGREPEPTPDTLKETSAIIRSIQADFGVAVDGDADRAILIDDTGDVKWGDRTTVVLAPYLKNKHPDLPPRIYTGVSSSYLIEDLLAEHGLTVVWMKVGSVGISRRLVKEGGLFGFEENGGFMYPVHQPVRDAGITTALFMELLAVEGKKASELYKIYPQTYTIKTKVPMDREKAVKAIENVKQAYGNNKYIDIDGIKVLLDNGWFLVRPSGTEPVLRIMIETTDKESAERVYKEIMDIIE